MGFEWAGMTIAWQCELDKWKRSVLEAHWPGVPIYDDITTLENPEPVDLMVGGFPCQDLSIAGKRKGFSGERSVLAFEFLRLAEALQPRWLVLENVPGLLSSNKGLDFGRLISEVVACGYGLGWRCLDARYFGVPQRRRRIFLVARRAEARFDSRTASGLALRALCEGGSGDTTPCIPPWQNAARTIGQGAEDGSIFNATGAFGNWVEEPRARELSRRDYKSSNHLALAYRKSARVSAPGTPETWVDDGRAAHSVVAFGHTQGIDIQPSEDVTPTLRVGGGGSAIASAYSIREDAKANTFSATPIDTARCLQKQQPSVQSHHAQTFIAKPPDIVRRLSPIECERLMGWPDNWTAPEAVKAPDSRRYAACGDGIVANVAYWIGQRIMQVDKETQ